MSKNSGGGLMSKKIFNSRITSANTQNSEKWFGYFFGPCLMYMVYYGVAGTYLTQFYTDVLGMSGVFITMMPIVCKIVDAITNIVMGRIIDKTRTKQGKARPWVLLSGIMICITGMLLYMVPTANQTVQILWIIVSYNLFFAFAFTIYNMSHALMVPLSTRNTKQRDTLAMFTSMGASMIPGVLVTMIMPFIIAAIGVGNESQGKWIVMMCVVSIVALPACLLEYYFTKERVTEDAQAVQSDDDAQQISFVDQMKACFTNKYWLRIMLVWALYQIIANLQSYSLVYYCNWVLSSSVSGGAALQVIVQAVGKAPLGFGVFLLWPLVHKFGKRIVSVIGYLVAAAGGIIIFIAGGIGAAIGGSLILSIGLLPTYVFMAMLAEALDDIEYVNGYRADGFSASIYSIIITVCAGISQSILLGGISLTGYVQPDAAGNAVQPVSAQLFFKMCYGGLPAILFIIMAVLLIGFNVEKMMPEISATLIQRQKDAAAARGEVYLSPEEKAAIEQEENDRIAEQKRIEQLKAKCEKKGLDFDEEEAKYQAQKAAAEAKAAEKQAKAEAKAAAKAAKKNRK